jgi:aspartyl-tRNA(Asn)/glutamyl-tRNA(Gln) amidotransferase subunit A
MRKGLEFLSIGSIASLLRSKKISPVELTEAVLARVERQNPLLNAYITLLAGRARADARRAEREISRGRYRGPLHGVPISIKDNIWVHGVRCTAGSKILADFVPSDDATVARRLARAGAVLIGKTNLHEFAYGITSENPHYGPARNPWAQDRVAGGSSGGSAAALAAGLCFASVGTDTGGSIRIPAALCGVAGLKPTFGRVSSYGVVPLERSLDHVGPLARVVGDLAILLQILRVNVQERL